MKNIKSCGSLPHPPLHSICNPTWAGVFLVMFVSCHLDKVLYTFMNCDGKMHSILCCADKDLVEANCYLCYPCYTKPTDHDEDSSLLLKFTSASSSFLSGL